MSNGMDCCISWDFPSQGCMSSNKYIPKIQVPYIQQFTWAHHCPLEKGFSTLLLP